MTRGAPWLTVLLVGGCTAPDDAPDETDTPVDSDVETDAATDDVSRDDTDVPADTDTDTDGGPPVYDPWPFIDAVVSFDAGAFAGFGQDGYPDIVYGPPESPGAGGSLDVLSLGDGGTIVVEFRDLDLIDGPGPDLLVFENPFPGWRETGVVGVSADGETWTEWPCDAADAEGEFPGCAGVGYVLASSANGVDATDPTVAGGDAFDLSTIGVERARYVRVRDSGANSYAGVSGGFDLDAMAVVNGTAR